MINTHEVVAREGTRGLIMEREKSESLDVARSSMVGIT